MENVSMDRPKRTLLYSSAMALYALLARLVFRMRFIGREHIPQAGSYIIMANHVCLLDPLTLAMCDRSREIHFMGKKELWHNRLLGWLFTKVHGFPVDRGNLDMTAIRTAMNVLKNGDTLGIFPEGTRSRTGHMLPLQGGAAMLALRSKCDVVPVYIDGRYKPFRRMVVRVGNPIAMDDLLAGRVTKEACDELTARIEAEFARVSGGKSLPAPAEQEKA